MTRILGLLLAVAWPTVMVLGQSQSSQPAPSPQQPQAQTQSQGQGQAPKKEEPTGEAAKKAQKEKPKPKKVYTEDDLSGMGGSGISVVGDDKPAGAKSATGKAGAKITPGSGQDEQYWRGRARRILDQIEATNQGIEKMQEDIKKNGSSGFEVQSGMKDGIAYIHDKNAQLDALQKHKADLEKKLDQLQEEGRKAGAEPAWFR